MQTIETDCAMLPPEVSAAWGLEGARVERQRSGLINRTFVALREDGLPLLVVQRLSPIFGPEVNLDIEAITQVLEDAGLDTPRLKRTLDGRPHVTDSQGGLWRALTFRPGRCQPTVETEVEAHSAGALLGRFHRALWDCPHVFRHVRPGIHDTARHLRHLARALDEHLHHPAFSEVETVARAILEHASRLPLPGDLPRRVVHGDPKITNMLFDERGEARCLLDLDTLARMPLWMELGDALRSWCNPVGEEGPGELRLDRCRAALAGWREAVGERPTAPELRAIPGAVEIIALELSARFCADALDERYFGWDPERFPSRSAHNLVRARSQLALARSAHAQAETLRTLL